MGPCVLVKPFNTRGNTKDSNSIILSEISQLAQLDKHQSAEQEAACSNLSQTNGWVSKWLRGKGCLCYKDICKQLDFLVFLDEDDKLYAPSRNPCVQL